MEEMVGKLWRCVSSLLWTLGVYFLIALAQEAVIHLVGLQH